MGLARVRDHLALGIVAVIIAVAKFITLTLTGMKVSSQAKSAGSPDGGNPLGRIINVYRENEGVDSETLQLKIDEAILKEQPSINRFIGLLKSSDGRTAAWAPGYCNRNDRDLPGDHPVWYW